MYAFGDFAQTSQGLKCVDGGTGWNVEMARLYSMTRNRWFEYNHVDDMFEACIESIVSLIGKTSATIGTARRTRQIRHLQAFDVERSLKEKVKELKSVDECIKENDMQGQYKQCRTWISVASTSKS